MPRAYPSWDAAGRTFQTDGGQLPKSFLAFIWVTFVRSKRFSIVLSWDKIRPRTQKNYRNEQAGSEKIGVNVWKVHRIHFPIIHRIEAECAYEKDRSTKNIHQHHNHGDEHTKSGPSDNPCCTGNSVPEVFSPTESLKHLGCKVSYFSSSQTKIVVIFTVR